MVVARDFDDTFEREQGCTETEWLGWLPGAARNHRLVLPGPGHAQVLVGDGTLHMSWQVLPPRQIALIRMPRLAVHYRFENVDAQARREFMRYFDLYLHRGGG